MGCIRCFVDGVIIVLIWIISKIGHVIFWAVFRSKKRRLPPIDNNILMTSATKLAKRIRTRKISSEYVVQVFIERVREVNPLVNAVVVERFEQALVEAKAVDEMLRNEDYHIDIELTPFLGVPFSIKEAFSVAGLAHSAGLVRRAKAGITAQNDATVVQRMKDAGAILILTSNTSEAMMWWESYNKVSGRTNNPYDLSRTAGGSSGGEGSIISSAGSVIGIGADLGGSIRTPAFMNGIFGHKPTAGVVPNEGQYPYPGEKTAQEYLCSGPMCRYAIDIIPMMKVLAKPHLSKLSLDTQFDVQSMKIFSMDSDGGNPCIPQLDDELKFAQKKVECYLHDKFSTPIIPVRVENMRYSFHIWVALMALCDDNPSMASILGGEKQPIKPIKELLKWMCCYSDHTFPAISVALNENFPKQFPNTLRDFSEMYQDMRDEWIDILQGNAVLLYPSWPSLALYHYQANLHPCMFAYTAIFNMLGFPVTQCPLGLSEEGLPLGVQLVSLPFKDNLTITLAKELETAFGGWIDPSQNK